MKGMIAKTHQPCAIPISRTLRIQIFMYTTNPKSNEAKYIMAGTNRIGLSSSKTRKNKPVTNRTTRGKPH